MFHLEETATEACEECIAYFNHLLNKKGIYLRLFHGHPHRLTIYVYHEQALCTLLQQEEISSFLKQFHYPKQLPEIMEHLQRRLHTSSYPHEIGIFLGYPLPDVIGFLKKEPCKLCGYWKVYSDTQKASMLFQEYREAEKELSVQLENGRHLCDLIA